MTRYQRKRSNTLDFVDNQNKDRSRVLDQFSLLRELPLDTIALIAQKMDSYEYFNFRSTCKQFRSLLPIARQRKNNMYPLLLFFERKEPPLCRLMDPCTNDSHHINVLPEFYPGVYGLDFSVGGWLLLRTDDDEWTSLHFFNPFKNVKGKFPPSHHVTNFTSIGISSCPTSPECVTVGISPGYGVCYYLFGEEKWHVHEFGSDEVQFWVESNVYHKGAFYFLSTAGNLGVFELVNKKAIWVVYDKPEHHEILFFHSAHLVECGGELLSIFIGDMGRWVRVFRFNQRKLKWVRARSLGNYVLFVGSSASFSVVEKEHEMRNRIYLPWLRGNKIIFYSLDGGKYGTLMGEESFEDLSGTKQLLRYAWIN